MKKKIDKEKVLKEALKKFKLLTEYTFYTEEPESDDDNLILGNLAEVDDEENPDNGQDSQQNGTNPPQNGQKPPNPQQSTPSNQNKPLPVQNNDSEAPTNGNDDIGMDDSDNNFETTDDSNDFSLDDEPEDDEVDIDVSELVDNTKEAKHAAKVAGKIASSRADKLLSKFSELESKIDSMSAISTKIDSLEREIARRNPTPNEKLELRSLDSAPFNIKLRDYWNDVEGYDVEPKKKEYILKKSDIDGNSLNSDIKKSFSNFDNEYEEEDI
jgi:hypothetical protein